MALLAGCAQPQGFFECAGAQARHIVDVEIVGAPDPPVAVTLVGEPYTTAGGCGGYQGPQALLIRDDDHARGSVSEGRYDELRVGFGANVLRLAGDFGVYEDVVFRLHREPLALTRDGQPLIIQRSEYVEGVGALRDLAFSTGKRPIGQATDPVSVSVHSLWNDGLSLDFSLDMVFAPGAPTEKYHPAGANVSVRVVAPNASVAWQGYADHWSGPAADIPLASIGTWRVEVATRPDDPPRESTHYHVNIAFGY